MQLTHLASPIYTSPNTPWYCIVACIYFYACRGVLKQKKNKEKVQKIPGKVQLEKINVHIKMEDIVWLHVYEMEKVKKNWCEREESWNNVLD